MSAHVSGFMPTTEGVDTYLGGGQGLQEMVVQGSQLKALLLLLLQQC